MTCLQAPETLLPPPAPTLEHRAEQNYLSILATTTSAGVPAVFRRLLPELQAALATSDSTPAGSPFVRFVVEREHDRADVEVGLPVAGPVRERGCVRWGVLPSGTYASARHCGPATDLVAAHHRLLTWVRAQGYTERAWPGEDGIIWAARTLTFPAAAAPASPDAPGELAVLVTPEAHRTRTGVAEAAVSAGAAARPDA